MWGHPSLWPTAAELSVSVAMTERGGRGGRGEAWAGGNSCHDNSLGGSAYLPASTEPTRTLSLCSSGARRWEHPFFLRVDICEVQMVSCGLRPQFLASWHVLPLCGGSLATSWLRGGKNPGPPPSGSFLRLSQSWEEVTGWGWGCYYFCLY